MPPDTLVAALLALLTQDGEGIPLHVKVTPSDELQRLRDENKALHEELDFWKKKLQSCEHMLSNEMQITDRLVGILRKHDITIPKNLYRFR